MFAVHSYRRRFLSFRFSVKRFCNLLKPFLLKGVNRPMRSPGAKAAKPKNKQKQ
jgi:hypothetical protein